MAHWQSVTARRGPARTWMRSPWRPKRLSAGRTSGPGVWAAGNAVNPFAQVITAAAAGSAAAMALNADLVEDDIGRATAGRRAAGSC